MRLHLSSLLAVAALLLSACNGADGTGGGSAGDLALGDRSIGSASAPVTIIEYASVTCGHCRTFHETTFPALKEKYIDTGKVRFVFREMPTPPVRMAMVGFLVARCLPPDQYFDMIDLQFRQQTAIFTRAQAEAPSNPDVVLDIYREIARSAGLTDETFDACLRDEQQIAHIRQVNEDASKRYGISSTPSFVINDEYRDDLAKAAGETFEITIEDFDAVLDPLLGDN